MPPKGLETVYIYPREYTTLLIRPLRASKLKIHRGGGIRPPGLSKYSQTPVFLGLNNIFQLFDSLRALKGALVCTDQEELKVFYIGGR